MKKGNRNYTNDDIIKHSKSVKSIAGLLRKLGLKPAGGNYYNIKKWLQFLDIDTSHWTGQGWNNGERLKDWSNYTKNESIKPHLIKERGHICEECGLEKWLGRPIPIELHHKDGDRTNNDPENLSLICPNCHTFTDNYKIRNITACKDRFDTDTP